MKEDLEAVEKMLEAVARYHYPTLTDAAAVKAAREAFARLEARLALIQPLFEAGTAYCRATAAIIKMVPSRCAEPLPAHLADAYTKAYEQLEKIVQEYGKVIDFKR